LIDEEALDIGVVWSIMSRHRPKRPVKALAAATPWLCGAWLLNPAIANTQPDQGIAAIKHLEYKDFQPDSERIRVSTTSVMLMSPVGENWSAQAVTSVDSISGASPYVQASELRRLKDFRRATDLSVTHHGADHSAAVTLSHSNEADYLSQAISALYTHATANRNLTLSFGLSSAKDKIRPVNKIIEEGRKNTQAPILSASIVVTPSDIVQVNLSRTASEGYHSDPYKFADERPERRTADVILIRWNHHLETSRSTLRFSQRFLKNDWGIRSQTFTAEYVWPLSERVSFSPSMRWYQQSSARFYVPSSKSQFPFGPRPGQLYSEDQRLAEFGAFTVGAQVLAKLTHDWQMDIKLERYEQRGYWQLDGKGSDGFVPFGARMFQIGFARLF